MNCKICGADLPEGAMFCGECGSSTTATPESRRPVDLRPGDTYVMHRSESGVISVPLEHLPPVEPVAEPSAPEAAFKFSSFAHRGSTPSAFLGSPTERAGRPH